MSCPGQSTAAFAAMGRSGNTKSFHLILLLNG